MKHFQMQFGHFMKGYLKAAQSRNASYSLRSLSRHLDMNSGNLSQILSGKRLVSRNKVSQILSKLAVTENDLNKILFSEKSDAENFIFDRYFNNFSSYKSIDGEQLEKLLSSDLNFKILALSETEGFQLDSAWVSERLQVPVETIELALDFLLDRGDLNAEKNYAKIDSYYKTSDGLKSNSIRKFHKQSLVEAVTKVDELPTPERDITSTVFSCSPDKFSEAQKLIRSFHNQLVSLMSVGSKSEVYKLNIQLYPCTYKKDKNE